MQPIFNMKKIAEGKVLSTIGEKFFDFQQNIHPGRLTNKLRSILCVNGRNGVFPPPKIYDEG